MVPHIGLRTHELLYEEIGNIVAEIYQPERKQNVMNRKPTILKISLYQFKIIDFRFSMCDVKII